MIRFIIVLLFTGVAFADTSTSSVMLRWKINNLESLEYRTFLDAMPVKYGVDIKSKELKDKKRTIKAINSLKLVPFPSQVPLKTTITKDATSLIVKMTNVAVNYDSSPGSEKDKLVRNYQKSLDGVVHLISNINDSGDNLSFYLKQRQKNLVSLLFQLPKSKVSINSHWTIPVNLIEAGPGPFHAALAERSNNAYLASISTIDGDRIAEIHYLISEKVEGYFETQSMKKVDSSFDISFIAYGEFLVDKGRWKRFRGQLTSNVQGTNQSSNKSLFALEPSRLD